MAKRGKEQEVELTKLKPYEKNAKIHSPAQVQKIADSIQEFGFLNACLIDKDYNIIAGHGRVEAAKLLGMKTVPCVFIEGLTEEQRKAYILADNKLTELGEWDMDLVTSELEELLTEGFDISLTGFELQAKAKEAQEEKENAARATLRDRFLVPPFSIFDTRTAWWLDRKRAWKAIGIKSELGRGADGDNTQDGLTYAKSHQPPEVYNLKNKYEDAIGRKITWDEFFEVCPNVKAQSSTSIFDPVITETAVRWYSKEGDQILDPFAGGSVRGIVSGLLGREYTGVDLSARQIEANKTNWEEIKKEPIIGEKVCEPRWINGDSLQITDHAGGKEYDLILTCPPYADLEVYSDDERDLSNMSYEDFEKTYRQIIKQSVSLLKENAFAFVVVGDIRDKKGNYRNFIGLTIDAFEKAGMHYYNEGVLITSTGAVAVVAGRQFSTSRKLAKTHQNVLVFHGASGIETINLEDTEETEQGFIDEIRNTEGKPIIAHKKALTFIKGNAKQRVNELGEVDADTNEEFFIDLE